MGRRLPKHRFESAGSLSARASAQPPACRRGRHRGRRHPGIARPRASAAAAAAAEEAADAGERVVRGTPRPAQPLPPKLLPPRPAALGAAGAAGAVGRAVAPDSLRDGGAAAAAASGARAHTLPERASERPEPVPRPCPPPRGTTRAAARSGGASHGRRTRVFAGDDADDARVLLDDEEVAEAHRKEEVETRRSEVDLSVTSAASLMYGRRLTTIDRSSGEAQRELLDRLVFHGRRKSSAVSRLRVGGRARLVAKVGAEVGDDARRVSKRRERMVMSWSRRMTPMTPPPPPPRVDGEAVVRRRPQQLHEGGDLLVLADGAHALRHDIRLEDRARPLAPREEVPLEVDVEVIDAGREGLHVLDTMIVTAIGIE